MFFKRFASIFFVFFLFILFALNINAAPWINLNLTYDGTIHHYNAESVYLYVNGSKIENLPMPPIIINGTTLVPAREALEPLGAVVDWKKETNEVFVAYNDSIVILKIGSNTANVNGNIINISIPAKIINNKTMVPVRFIAESFGLDVNWDNESRNINIAEIIKETTTELTTEFITQQFTIQTETTEITTSEKIPNFTEDIKYNKTDIIDFSYNENGLIIKTEKEIEKFNLINSSNQNVIAFDIYNTLPNLPLSVFNTSNSSFIKQVSFTVVQENPFPITRLIVEMNTPKQYNASISNNRCEFIIKFNSPNITISETYVETTTQTVVNNSKPSIDTSKYTKRTFNNSFNYDSSTKCFVISKSSNNININDIKINDDYANRRFKITIPYNYSNIINEGVYSVSDTYIDSAIVEYKNGSTDFIILEKSIMAYDVSEDGNYIYIKAMLPKQKYSKIVVIDAGHGGHDDGTNGNGIIEKDLNLDIAKKLTNLLENDKSIKVYAIRLSDIYYTRPERANFANELGDLFVSIHNNSFTGEAANGTEVWYYPHSNDSTIGFTSEQFAKITQRNLVNSLQSADRGIKNNNFDVLVLTKMPAILCEIGFVSNNKEASLLKSENYKQKSADAIYKSIVEVFNVYNPKR